MASVPEILLISFLIGLTGALAPGPTLVATIQSSMKKGWTMGPKVSLGHMFIETLVFLLIVLGISATAARFSGFIAIIGGGALIVFGILTLRESRTARLDHPSGTIIDNPYLAGIITGITNPYFWIWWLTIGSSLLVNVMEAGIIFGIIFMIGHWMADVGWLTVVSAGIHRGRMILSPRGYTITLSFCGLFLILFGGYYLSMAFMGRETIF
jgi:threonine/homoserine/homoserine lactone efflux protein